MPLQPTGAKDSEGSEGGSAAIKGGAGGVEEQEGKEEFSFGAAVTYVCSERELLKLLLAMFLYHDAMGTLWHNVMVYAKADLGAPRTLRTPRHHSSPARSGPQPAVSKPMRRTAARSLSAAHTRPRPGYRRATSHPRVSRVAARHWAAQACRTTTCCS